MKKNTLSWPLSAPQPETDRHLGELKLSVSLAVLTSSNLSTLRGTFTQCSVTNTLKSVSKFKSCTMALNTYLVHPNYMHLLSCIQDIYPYVDIILHFFPNKCISWCPPRYSFSTWKNIRKNPLYIVQHKVRRQGKKGEGTQHS